METVWGGKLKCASDKNLSFLQNLLSSICQAKDCNLGNVNNCMTDFPVKELRVKKNNLLTEFSVIILGHICSQPSLDFHYSRILKERNLAACDI